jgi:hypothetical protein
MPAGYRTRTRKAQRRAKRQRWQLIGLYVLAPIVAVGAVVGAYFMAQAFTGAEPPDTELGRLELIVVGGKAPSATAGLALRDPVTRGYRFYTVPRALLLEGPEGEYIMAGDEMGHGTLRRDLGSLVGVPVRQELRLTYRQLERLAGGGTLVVKFEQPAKLKVDGVWRTYEGTVDVPAAEIGPLLAAEGSSGEDEDVAARAVYAAVFHASALQTAADRRRITSSLAATAGDDDRQLAARRVLNGLLERPVEVQRIPSKGAVTEGQFAFRPDRSRIMTDITRLAPGFGPRYTIIIRNGTGEAGVGALVRKKLAVLDAQLPSPANAEDFGYERTQILAGSKALALAEDVRAILARGVVLSGQDVPATTLVVIIGADLKAKDLQ